VNAFVRRLVACSVWAISVAAMFSACQTSTNAPAETAASERTSVVAKYTVSTAAPQKVADSATWIAGQNSGAGIVPVVDFQGADKVTYAAGLSLSTPLGSQALTLSLWKCGVRIIRLTYTAVGNTNELTLTPGSAAYDQLALALFDTLNSRGEALTRAKMVELYASWLLAGDAKALTFPDSLPIGLSRQEVVQAVLVAASKTGSTLASLAKNWSLDISVDSARTLTLQLIASSRISSSDSAKLFPPPTIRVDAPLTVAAGLVVGGSPVAIHGSFGWNPGLGAVTFRSRVMSGTEIVASSAITASGLPAPSGSATHASLDSVGSILIATPLALEGDYQLVVVGQVAGGDSAKATTTFHVGPKTGGQAGVPNVRLASPADGSTVPFETKQIATSWVVTTPQGSIDTVTLDGVAAKSVNDSTWSGSVSLAPTGKAQTVVLRAHSTSGLSTTQVAFFTRLADLTGPVITWISPAADLEVENGVSSLTVRVKVADPSGIDTVLIAGKRPDSLNASGEWVRKVPITTTGSPMAIVVRAVDGAKNASASSMNVTRQNPSTDIPPSVVLVSPSVKTGTVVVWDSAFATVRWTITDPYGIDSSSVIVNGIDAVSEPGNNWSARVPLGATGSPTSIALSVKNKNGISGGDVISITRRADTTKPVLTVVAGSRKVGYDSAEVAVICNASDNDSLTSVTIGGLEATKQGDVYVGKLKIEVGDSRYAIVARDRAMNSVSVDVELHRYQKMSIARAGTSADTSVPASTSSLSLRWLVAGAAKVTGAEPLSVGGRPVAGAYVTNATLNPGTNSFTLVATDSAGRVDSLKTSVTRRSQAALKLSYGLDTTGTLPDSVVIAATSETGASLAWSMDGVAWVPFTGSFVQKLSGAALVRAQVDGKDDSIASLKSFTLFHANHAPTVALSSPGITLKSYLGTFQVQAASVVNWGAGDAGQSGAWEVQSFVASDLQFLSDMVVDASGKLSGTIKIDTSLTLKVRLRLRDDGGTANGGVDLSEWTGWLEIQLVDTVMDRGGNIYRARRMPDGKIWMRSNLRTRPITSTSDRCASSNCDTYGALYTWSEAMNLPVSADSLWQNIAANPTGLCPEKWGVPSEEDWATLESQIGLQTMKSKSGWVNLAGCAYGKSGLACSVDTSANGSDKFGFTLVPSTSRTAFDGTPYSVQAKAGFWVSAQNGATNAYYREFDISSAGSTKSFAKNGIGTTTDPSEVKYRSIRCIYRI